ncbi:MAG: DUF2334 domain-containing protein [Deltaproteobacteria bacterium]|nr:DUF2334 domain-containing protein [Deltaproteobacteria bacterium]
MSSRINIWKLVFLALLPLFFPQEAAFAGECIRIYYDHADDPDYSHGRLHAVFVQNLLGHFPEFQQIVEPIEEYTPGEIDQCRATIYIGSYFENAIPEAFLDDFEKTGRNVAWLGYSIWKYDNVRLEKLLGHIYPWEDSDKLTRLDWERPDSQGRPTFFKNILYKGEIFPKFGKFDSQDPSRFIASYEMVKLRRKSSRQGRVLAWAEQNGTGEKIPYIIRNRNRFYVADVPFAFRNEDDRYLVFADLLFDILDVAPRYEEKKPAIFRIEDVHPEIDLRPLRNLIAILREYGIPFQISLIPIYADPEGVDQGKKNRITPLHVKKEFLEFLNELDPAEVTFIWHGVTHQYRDWKNPYNGVSGDDFEFWDAREQAPLAEDSPDFVLDRLEDGWQALSKGGVKPAIWEVPHYQASALDYLIFSRVFSWTIGRILYCPYRVTGLPDFSPDLWFENELPDSPAMRRGGFQNLSVVTSGKPEGQLFPYEIYGDIYGQRVLPENLGNIQPYEDASVKNPRSVDDLIRTARRNKVLRDVWGSLFFHTYCMTSFRKGGMERDFGETKEIRRLLQAMLEDYQFINLTEWVRDKKEILRPEPIIHERKRRE